jgi:hypothetical protein
MGQVGLTGCEDVYLPVNHSEIVGKPLHWELRGFFKPDWRLYFKDRQVASLVSKRFTSLDRDGSYDCFPVDMRYEKRFDQVTMSNPANGKTICRIENATNPPLGKGSEMFVWTIKLEGGLTYTTRYDDPWKSSESSFRNENGTLLAKTKFHSSAPQTSVFTLLSSMDTTINPWLIALITHYHTLAVSTGS